MPMSFAREEPYDVPRTDLFYRAALLLDSPKPGNNNKGLTKGMCMPGCASPRLECDGSPGCASRLLRLE